MLLKQNQAYPNVLDLLPRFGVNLDLCFWNKHFAANAQEQKYNLNGRICF